jgi:putative uncharacterized protein (fragment)
MNQREKINLCGHVLLLLFELLVVIHAFAGEGLATLRFYTTDSNLLCGVASALFLLQRGKPDTMVRLLRFIATSCLLVTFTVVLLVLGPQNGYAHEFLGGTRLFSHLLCPFLSLVLFLTGEERAPQRWVGYALFTTLLYAIPMIILNGMGLVSGPYSFLKVREQSLASTLFWIVVILGGNALLARAAVLLQKKLFKR